MKIESKQLIEELLRIVERSIISARKFRELKNDQLNFKQAPDKWSILECLEHLNLYGDFYLPEIQKQISGQKISGTDTVFQSGILGNYFANLMLVNNGKIKKMKSPKDKNPANSTLTVETIDKFLHQMDQLKSLLVESKKVDLTKTKTAISLSKLIRLRLGDTFRFFVYHLERHRLQAERNFIN